MAQFNGVDPSLFARYGKEAFMYVEYPHKRFWDRPGGDKRFREKLKRSLMDGTPQMLYVHMPYCHKQCLFCTCHVEISLDYDDVIHYVKLLNSEIDLLKDFESKCNGGFNIQEIHLGGGSPTYMKQEEFDQLVQKLSLLTRIEDLKEFAIEIDPRRVKVPHLEYYAKKGINRISIGVQDFDRKVQQAVDRVQPVFLTERLLTSAVREMFPNGINFDIICGLPFQTLKTIKETIKKVSEMAPDRICLNYLHFAPTFHQHQLDMPLHAIPDMKRKKELFLAACEILRDAGYVRLGYDHFALPSDPAARAMEKGEMDWNRLGVTAGRYDDVLGIGVNSTGSIGPDYYCQNVYEIDAYERSLKENRFPISADYSLNEEDLLRRAVILSLRSYFEVEFKNIEREFRIDFQKHFRMELQMLKDFEKNSLLTLTENKISITDLGRQFANLICSVFDAYLRSGTPRQEPKSTQSLSM